MSQIKVTGLTFGYDGSYENIFENVSFEVDTDWRLGFIGRNGRGKTTFLNLLRGKYEYRGSISACVEFDYFPFEVDMEGSSLKVVRGIIAPFDEWEAEMEACLADGSEAALERYGEVLELFMAHDGYAIDQLIEREIGLLDVEAEVLTRPFSTLSNGQRTKLMLAALFLKKNNFLLIDEPTNHLDMEGRQCVAQYLKLKKGFILVSHDRSFVDETVDHILSINKADIEVQKGNFSSWRENRRRQDELEQAQNDRLLRDINAMDDAFRRTEKWSLKTENETKDSAMRRYAKKSMKRAKCYEAKRDKAIEEKKSLLKNIEHADALKIHPEKYVKETMIFAQDLTADYGAKQVLSGVTFELKQGDRLALRGKNGCGKTTLIKLILGGCRLPGGLSAAGLARLTGQNPPSQGGTLRIGSNLTVSYVSQDTSFLKGSMEDFMRGSGVDETLFRTILAKLEFRANAFGRPLEKLSEGQKKKVLIARSLSERANLYIWDEPLNYIDVIARMQIEDLILEYEPTMIFVEHDKAFADNVATGVLEL